MKFSKTILAASVALALAQCSGPAAALPTNGVFTYGGGTISVNGTTESITVNGTSLITWGSGGLGGFVINPGEAVNYSATAPGTPVVINYDASGNASQINGALNAPGLDIFLVNPNGVSLGSGAQISVGGAFAVFGGYGASAGVSNGSPFITLGVNSAPAANISPWGGGINCAAGGCTAGNTDPQITAGGNFNMSFGPSGGQANGIRINMPQALATWQPTQGVPYVPLPDVVAGGTGALGGGGISINWSDLTGNVTPTLSWGYVDTTGEINAGGVGATLHLLNQITAAGQIQIATSDSPIYGQPGLPIVVGPAGIGVEGAYIQSANMNAVLLAGLNPHTNGFDGALDINSATVNALQGGVTLAGGNVTIDANPQPGVLSAPASVISGVAGVNLEADQSLAIGNNQTQQGVVSISGGTVQITNSAGAAIPGNVTLGAAQPTGTLSPFGNPVYTTGSVQIRALSGQMLINASPTSVVSLSPTSLLIGNTTTAGGLVSMDLSTLNLPSTIGPGDGIAGANGVTIYNTAGTAPVVTGNQGTVTPSLSVGPNPPSRDVAIYGGTLNLGGCIEAGAGCGAGATPAPVPTPTPAPAPTPTPAPSPAPSPSPAQAPQPQFVQQVDLPPPLQIRATDQVTRPTLTANQLLVPRETDAQTPPQPAPQPVAQPQTESQAVPAPAAQGATEKKRR